MSFFGKILEKLGLKKAAAEPAPAPPAPKVSTPPPVATPVPARCRWRHLHRNRSPSSMSLRKELEKLAAANPQKLNWKTSIVDLLKLLDIDSSFAARKELATELGCPGDLMGDSARMNMWLHKTVLQQIADNGGNIRKSCWTDGLNRLRGTNHAGHGHARADGGDAVGFARIRCQRVPGGEGRGGAAARHSRRLQEAGTGAGGS